MSVLKTPIFRNLLVAGLMTAIASLTVTAEPIALENRFKMEEVAWIRGEGNASLTGKAFIKLENGEYQDCAGFQIELLPVTPYSKERIEKTYGNTEHGQILLSQNPPSFTPDAKAYHEMEIIGKCDEEGIFRFDNIKAGEFFIMAFIIWDEEQQGEKVKQGGGVMHYIHLKDNQSQTVVMRND